MNYCSAEMDKGPKVMFVFVFAWFFCENVMGVSLSSYTRCYHPGCDRLVEIHVFEQFLLENFAKKYHEYLTHSFVLVCVCPSPLHNNNQSRAHHKRRRDAKTLSGVPVQIVYVHAVQNLEQRMRFSVNAVMHGALCAKKTIICHAIANYQNGGYHCVIRILKMSCTFERTQSSVRNVNHRLRRTKGVIAWFVSGVFLYTVLPKNSILVLKSPLSSK